MRATIVHLSDIHLTGKADAIFSKVRSLAAAICSTDAACNDYIVVLSGDIAAHGMVEEYDTAKLLGLSRILCKRPGG